jgi:hypothetical protein
MKVAEIVSKFKVWHQTARTDLQLPSAFFTAKKLAATCLRGDGITWDLANQRRWDRNRGHVPVGGL